MAEKLAQFSDLEVLNAIKESKSGGATEKPVKQVEPDAILAAPEGRLGDWFNRRATSKITLPMRGG